MFGSHPPPSSWKCKIGDFRFCNGCLLEFGLLCIEERLDEHAKLINLFADRRSLFRRNFLHSLIESAEQSAASEEFNAVVLQTGEIFDMFRLGNGRMFNFLYAICHVIINEKIFRT